MALPIAALSLVLVATVIALYPSVSDVLANLSDASATMNRALGDIESAAESFVELANRALEEIDE